MKHMNHTHRLGLGLFCFFFCILSCGEVRYTKDVNIHSRDSRAYDLAQDAPMDLAPNDKQIPIDLAVPTDGNKDASNDGIADGPVDLQLSDSLGEGNIDQSISDALPSDASISDAQAKDVLLSDAVVNSDLIPQDASKQDAAKQDAAKQDASKQDAAKQDAAKQMDAKPFDQQAVDKAPIPSDS